MMHYWVFLGFVYHLLAWLLRDSHCFGSQQEIWVIYRSSWSILALLLILSQSMKWYQVCLLSVKIIYNKKSEQMYEQQLFDTCLTYVSSPSCMLNGFRGRVVSSTYASTSFLYLIGSSSINFSWFPSTVFVNPFVKWRLKAKTRKYSN